MGSEELRMKNVELRIIQGMLLRGELNLIAHSVFNRRSNLMNMAKYKEIATSILFWIITITEAPRKGFEFLIRKAL
tara:strand:+ start:296 stop:523 length:228 start_codon:yes stop_codon:yes gene_type:complete